VSHEQTEALSSGAKAKKRIMSSPKSAYVWGSASGVALAIFVPMSRPAARNAVKGGIKVGRMPRK